MSAQKQLVFLEACFTARIIPHASNVPLAFPTPSRRLHSCIHHLHHHHRHRRGSQKPISGARESARARAAMRINAIILTAMRVTTARRFLTFPRGRRRATTGEAHWTSSFAALGAMRTTTIAHGVSAKYAISASTRMTASPWRRTRRPSARRHHQHHLRLHHHPLHRHRHHHQSPNHLPCRRCPRHQLHLPYRAHLLPYITHRLPSCLQLARQAQAADHPRQLQPQPLQP